MASETYVDTAEFEKSISQLKDYLAKARKESLLYIMEYAHNNPLPLEHGEMLKGGLLTMFVEKQPLVYSQFVDTIEAILECWSKQVVGWVSMIIAKFLQKLGTDTMMKPLDDKIRKLLVNITKHCPGDLVLSCIFRAYADPSQPMNRKTITISLHYLVDVSRRIEQGDFSRSDESSKGFEKVSGWFSNKNAFIDIQRASKQALLNLFRLNSSTFMQLKSELPITKEPFVRQLISDQILHTDGFSPEEECRFFSPPGSAQEREYLAPSHDLMNAKPTKSPSYNQSQLGIPDYPARPASSEEIKNFGYSNLPSKSKKNATLPRRMANAYRSSEVHDNRASPTQSKLPLSRTTSLGKKPSYSGDPSRQSPSYRASPKLEIGASRLPRLATVDDDSLMRDDSQNDDSQNDDSQNDDSQTDDSQIKEDSQLKEDIQEASGYALI